LSSEKRLTASSTLPKIRGLEFITIETKWNTVRKKDFKKFREAQQL
jgi:hypothetical protein